MLREVMTKYGKVRGIWAADPRITAFKGIPFAAPPVGENRWRAPRPPKRWEGVLDACRFAPVSMQNIPGLGTDIYCREWNVDPTIPMDEDCLYLNVWTGAKSADEKLPVLVWFFGGGLQCGSTAEMEFDGERIARRGVVVVSVNYRVNVFGFLSHPQLTEEQPEAPANFGSLDQQAGIRWVKENIEAFGGDPGNVTIAGQSAGGGSVLSQMAYPGNEGLFQKAIIMSAMIRNPYEGGGFGSPVPLEAAEKTGEDFFTFLGVGSLEQARALDACLIRDKYEEYCQTHRGMGVVLDGQFCVGDPLALLAGNKLPNIPVMAGNTGDEFPSAIRVDSAEGLKAEAERLFGEWAEEFLSFPEAHQTREGDDPGKVFAAPGGYAPINSIECMAKSVFLTNRERGGDRNFYYYRFAADVPGWDNPGTFHSVDLWFFFETLAKCWRPFVGRHYDLARQMCNYLANFVKNGDPNGNDADGTPMPRWESYEKERRCEMIFTSKGAQTKWNEEPDFMKFMIDRVSETW